MATIKIAALTTNHAYRGRHFKTPALIAFQTEVSYLLPKMKVPAGKLKVKYEFGVSSKLADYDNCVKAFQDCLSQKYGFNDNRIYRAEITKKDVPSGKEYIKYQIETYRELTGQVA